MKKLIKYTIIAILGIFLAVTFTAVIGIMRMEGQSMSPQIKQNEILFINKLAYIRESPSKDDVIVFKTNVYSEDEADSILVKRVVAVEGDLIEGKSDGLYVNGKNILSKSDIENYKIKNQVVGSDKVFVLGDNPKRGTDSRDPAIGQIHSSDIIGKVISHFGI